MKLLFNAAGNSTYLKVILYIVKPVLRVCSKIDKTKILMTNGSLMKIKSIAECSLWSTNSAVPNQTAQREQSDQVLTVSYSDRHFRN